jgi:hypothetical protein
MTEIDLKPRLLVKDFLGSIEPKTFSKFENGLRVTYGYAIHRDAEGNETHRTEPTVLSSVGYEDGTPFTEDDYNSIMVKKKGFFGRLFNW